jgi:hypothetical protein
VIATPSRILLKMLVDGGVVVSGSAGATTTKWATFLGPLPAMPKTAVGLTDFGADTMGQLQRTAEPVSFWRVQVMIRGLDYNAAGQMGNRIDTFLRRVGRQQSLGGLGEVGVVVDAETFVIPHVKPVTRLAYLSKNDEDSTHVWVMNERFSIRLLP